MSDVRASSPSAAAAAPSHPEHPRWLRDRTLGMEIVHAQQNGGTLRDAETANMAALQRLDAKKRAPKPTITAASVAAAERRELARESRKSKLGVVKKAVAPVLVAPASLCNKCGLCGNCKRELRVAAIMTKARQGDRDMQHLTHTLIALMFAMKKRIDAKIAPHRTARGREVPFSRMIMQGERNIAFLGAVADVCDWSVRWLGNWR